ncbi:MAG: hypothetical protein R3D80_20945 [Paracoccaceae bacterium]
MNEVTIWHNLRCSKSRETRRRGERGLHPTARKYLEDAPDEAESGRPSPRWACT